MDILKTFFHNLLIPYVFALQILVEFDESTWDTREWLNVYKDGFSFLAVEQTLVLAHRSGQVSQGNLHPALVS